MHEAVHITCGITTDGVASEHCEEADDLVVVGRKHAGYERYDEQTENDA